MEFIMHTSFKKLEPVALQYIAEGISFLLLRNKSNFSAMQISDNIHNAISEAL